MLLSAQLSKICKARNPPPSLPSLASTLHPFWPLRLAVLGTYGGAFGSKLLATLTRGSCSPALPRWQSQNSTFVHRCKEVSERKVYFCPFFLYTAFAGEEIGMSLRVYPPMYWAAQASAIMGRT